jgi:hypothetical protein
LTPLQFPTWQQIVLNGKIDIFVKLNLFLIPIPAPASGSQQATLLRVNPVSHSLNKLHLDMTHYPSNLLNNFFRVFGTSAHKRHLVSSFLNIHFRFRDQDCISIKKGQVFLFSLFSTQVCV